MRFLQLIAGYKDIQELTVPMLNELIDRIEVGKKETVDGVKRQEIRIVYKQFCYVEFEEFWDFLVTKKERTALVQAAARIISGLHVPPEKWCGVAPTVWNTEAARSPHQLPRRIYFS